MMTLGVLALAAIYSCSPKEKIDKKAFAAAFSTKKWYYSTDGGKTWADRAEPGLKGFTDTGDPIHILPEWIWGQWQDENTILWTATDNTTSLWKSFDVTMSEEELAKVKGYAAAFPSKKWFYSLDDGKNWIPGAEEGLKGFSQNGIPIHVSEAWISSSWKDENLIQWRAVDGSECLWKAFDGSEAK